MRLWLQEYCLLVQHWISVENQGLEIAAHPLEYSRPLGREEDFEGY